MAAQEFHILDWADQFCGWRDWPEYLGSREFKFHELWVDFQKTNCNMSEQDISRADAAINKVFYLTIASDSNDTRWDHYILGLHRSGILIVLFDRFTFMVSLPWGPRIVLAL